MIGAQKCNLTSAPRGRRYALVNGKPILIKLQYSNSFPDKVTRELVSVSYRQSNSSLTAVCDLPNITLNRALVRCSGAGSGNRFYCAPMR